MPEVRTGTQALSPPFNSSPSKPIRDGAKIEEIIGSELFDAYYFEAGEALFGPQDSYTMYAVLTFNTQERAILVFYDEINAPSAEENPDWAPRQWRKKLPDDGGAMYQKAVAIMKWV